MRVALLTNFVAPYRVAMFRELRERVGELRILAATAIERNRQWRPEWGDLDVVVQKSLSIRRKWRHERFTDAYEQHIPLDTFQQLRRFRPDVIISGGFAVPTLQATAYAKAARVPLILWGTLTKDLEESRGLMRTFLRRRLVRLADRIIVNGESGVAYLRWLGVEPGAIVVIPQTTDLRAFLAIPIERAEDAARRLLCVGMISELKGSDLLIAALQVWAERHPRESLALTMIGEGPLRTSLQQVALPGNVRVEWTGAVQYDELAKWYARAGILVFPTQGDEWGLVVNEAMAAGLPVLGSEYSQAVTELVEDTRNGWQFRPDDAPAITRAIERVLATPDAQLAAMRSEARATAARLTPQSVAAQFAAVAHELTGT